MECLDTCISCILKKDSFNQIFIFIFEKPLVHSLTYIMCAPHFLHLFPSKIATLQSTMIHGRWPEPGYEMCVIICDKTEDDYPNNRPHSCTQPEENVGHHFNENVISTFPQVQLGEKVQVALFAKMNSCFSKWVDSLYIIDTLSIPCVTQFFWLPNILLNVFTGYSYATNVYLLSSWSSKTFFPLAQQKTIYVVFIFSIGFVIWPENEQHQFFLFCKA